MWTVERHVVVSQRMERKLSDGERCREQLRAGCLVTRNQRTEESDLVIL